MNTPDLDALTEEEIRHRLRIAIFDVELYARIASLRGITYTLDLVETTDPEHPDGYTKIVVTGLETPP